MVQRKEAFLIDSHGKMDGERVLLAYEDVRTNVLSPEAVILNMVPIRSILVKFTRASLPIISSALSVMILASCITVAFMCQFRSETYVGPGRLARSRSTCPIRGAVIDGAKVTEPTYALGRKFGLKVVAVIFNPRVSLTPAKITQQSIIGEYSHHNRGPLRAGWAMSCQRKAWNAGLFGGASISVGAHDLTLKSWLPSCLTMDVVL